MKVKENTNIVQANYLIENRPSFTKDETRLFLTIIGAINKDDEDFKPFKIPVTDFADLWGIDGKNAYNTVKNALRGLRNKEFYIEGVNPETGKRRFLTSSSISSAVYEEGEGYATVEVSRLFKPYLLEIKSNYTKYVLENIMNLSTVNAIRNYEFLKQYENAKERTFEVEDYKKKLHIENKYSDNTDLKRYVVDPAIKEINANTDIFVDYEMKGRGKRAKLIFYIEKKKNIPIVEAQKAPEVPKDDEKRTWYLDYLSGACNDEFELLDIETFLDIIKEKIPFTIDRLHHHTQQKHYSFLKRAYIVLKQKEKTEEVRNRAAFVRGVLKKMETFDSD